jgi:hypothetical protein
VAVSAAIAAVLLSAPLFCGNIIHMAHPAMAMAGSTVSRASELPNDHPAIRIAVPSPDGAADCRASHKKGPTA